MQTLTPKNWGEFQHYKDRSPSWIKLHKKILDDYKFHCLPLASKALAPMLWLLASEYEQGEIEFNTEELAFRLRMKPQEFTEAVKPLIEFGFFNLKGECLQDASELLAGCLPREEKRREEIEKSKRIDIVRSVDTHPAKKNKFDQFWEKWPNSPRKVAKKKCQEKWKKLDLDPIYDQVIGHVEEMKKTSQWQTGYEPSPITYLNQNRWLDPIPQENTISNQKQIGISKASAEEARIRLFGNQNAVNAQ